MKYLYYFFFFFWAFSLSGCGGGGGGPKKLHSGAYPCGTKGNFYLGRLYSPLGAKCWGGSCEITTYTPILCAGGQSFSGAWVNLGWFGGFVQAGINNNNISGHSTKGIIQMYYEFASEDPNCRAKDYNYGAPSPGKESFKIQEENGDWVVYCGKKRMATSGLPGNPKNCVGRCPNQVKFCLETHHCETQCMGDPKTKVDFTNCQVKLEEKWQIPPNFGYYPEGAFAGPLLCSSYIQDFNAAVSPNSFKVYDKRY